MDDKQLNIDMVRTGLKMRALIIEHGYSVKEIQDYLHLSCPQSIYRWFRGETLPSVDNLYRLAVLMKVHMEAFLVQTEYAEEWRASGILCIEISSRTCRKGNLYKNRLQSYYQMIAA